MNQQMDGRTDGTIDTLSLVSLPVCLHSSPRCIERERFEGGRLASKLGSSGMGEKERYEGKKAGRNERGEGRDVKRTDNKRRRSRECVRMCVLVFVHAFFLLVRQSIVCGRSSFCVYSVFMCICFNFYVETGQRIWAEYYRTSDAGSQYRCGRVGTGQGHPTPIPT